MDNEYDFIVCNPPWLNANYVYSQNDFENAVYDPNHEMLKSVFNFASKLILFLIFFFRNSFKQKKPKCQIYSSLF